MARAAKVPRRFIWDRVMLMGNGWATIRKLTAGVRAEALKMRKKEAQRRLFIKRRGGMRKKMRTGRPMPINAGGFRQVEFGPMPPFPEKIRKCFICGKEGTEDSIQHYYGVGLAANGSCLLLRGL